MIGNKDAKMRREIENRIGGKRQGELRWKKLEHDLHQVQQVECT